MLVILYYHWKIIIVPREGAVRWRKEPLPAETGSLLDSSCSFTDFIRIWGCVLGFGNNSCRVSNNHVTSFTLVKKSRQTKKTLFFMNYFF